MKMSHFKNIKKNIKYSQEYLKKLEKKSYHLNIRCEKNGYVNIFHNNSFHFLSENIIIENKHIINYHEKTKIFIFEEELLPLKGNYYCEFFYGVYKYNVETKKFDKLNTFIGKKILNSQFSPDGKIFVYFGGYRFHIYNVEKNEILEFFCGEIVGYEEKGNFKISNDNSTIILFKENKFILYDIKTEKQELCELKSITCSKIGDIFFKDNDNLIIGCLNGLILEYKKGKINVIKHDKNYEFNKGLFSPCGNIFCVSVYFLSNSQLKIISVFSSDYSKTEIIKHNNICFSPDSRYVLATYNDEMIVKDISNLGIKNKQIFEFLKGLYDPKSSIYILGKNYLFDRNILELIFDFIPYF